MSEDQSRNEVSVRAAITDSSLSVGARSRAISTLDRLLGGFFGIPAAWLERFEERIRKQTDRESIIQGAAASRVQAAILNDEEISEVIAALALSSRLTPIANKMRVAELAVEDLLGSASENEPSADESDGGEVDLDWLNHFASYAEKASSEGVRNLWARVLAGEIRRSGSFSLSSLRLLAELDQRMATTFENVVQYRYNDEFILKPKIEEMQGLRLNALTFLEEVGLLQTIDAIGGVVRKINPNNDGVAIMRERELLLVLELQKTVELPIILLTRAGREIAGILPPANPLEVLERVGAVILDQVTSADIRRIMGKTQTGFVASPVKTLKAKQIESTRVHSDKVVVEYVVEAYAPSLRLLSQYVATVKVRVRVPVGNPVVTGR